MRKLYDKFFRVSNHEKISGRVMLTRIAVTATIIMICLISMSYTAYAYFSYNITSDSNVIKSAGFEAELSIEGQNGETVTVITDDDINFTAEIKANTNYIITLEHNDKSTVQTGFVIITADNCNNKYHTAQINKNGVAVSFELRSDADTVLYFKSHWGTSSYYCTNGEFYLQNGEKATLHINGAVPQSENSNRTDVTEENTEEQEPDTFIAEDSSFLPDEENYGELIAETEE